MERPESWYGISEDLSLKQRLYCKYIEMNFCMRNNVGQPIPYSMTDYQREFHSHSLNIMEDESEDILFIKARGISFTFSSAIELIISCMWYENQTFPIIAQRQDSAKTILDTMKWLIQNCKIQHPKTGKHISEYFVMSSMKIKFLENNSQIVPFPSGSAASAVRSLRLIRAMIDEYAFQRGDKELFAAVQDTMQTKLQQIILGSTPCGRHNHFFELVNNPVGFKVFRLPVFEEHLFNPQKSILEQPHLVPIAPWIDMEKLEMKRTRDYQIFMQEQMCDFLDDSISFIPYGLIKRCENPQLTNYNDIISKVLNFQYQTNNAMVWGIDVARTTHLTAISGFEIMEDDEGKKIAVQRVLYLIKDTSIPDQVAKIKNVLSRFKTTVKVRVDMTGLGLGLYEYLKKDMGAVVEGIMFGGKIKTGEAKQSAKIREWMVVNLKNQMESGWVQLLPDEEQAHHLTSISYDFKVTEDAHGHGDILFADAMALLPLDYTVIASEPLIIGGRKEGVVRSADPKEWDIGTTIDWLKHGQGRKGL